MGHDIRMFGIVPIAGMPTPMDDERIDCQWFHLHEVEVMIEKGQVQDAKTLIGWALWRLKGKG
jgi:hypothetical protein